MLHQQHKSDMYFDLTRWVIVASLLLGLHDDLLAITYSKASAKTDTTKSIFDIISTEEVLHLSIKTDINNLLVNKNTDDKQKAELVISNIHEDYTTWNVNVNVRGKFRRMKCDFPPLKIKFNKSELGELGLNDHASLKLVTHCTDKAEDNELILKEYLAYKLYNIITHHSFRVQLVKIDWIDESQINDIGAHWGFLIEDKDELEERLQCTAHDKERALHSHINDDNASVCYLFQYMIGNHDWMLESGQNMHYMKSNDSDELVAVAYDFDFSVMVNSYYSTSPFTLSKSNKRAYMGYSTEEESKEAKELFKSKKKEIINEIKSFDVLSKKNRREVTNYIKSFYLVLDEPLVSKRN